MSIFRPSKTAKVWWYEFTFSGQRIRESSKSHSKKVAKDAEKARRRELEESFNGIKRRDRAKLFSVAAEEWLTTKALTLAPSSLRIERDNLKHVLPRFEKRLVTDIEARDVHEYQTHRLAQGASPKTVNLEVGTLRGILRRARVWQQIQIDIKMLATRDDIGHALTAREESLLLEECRNSRCRQLYVAVMLALNTGMRYSEIRLLRWKQIDFANKVLTVGKSKTATGTDRRIPLNARILHVLQMWAANFSERQPDHFVFPFEKYGAIGTEEKFGFTGPITYDTDPGRPIGEWKEAWEQAKKRTRLHCPECSNGILTTGKDKHKCNSCGFETKELPQGVCCRYHDLRHSACTRMLEAGVPYPVVARMMGWSASTAIRMAKRYGHIGDQALEAAADVLAGKTEPGYFKKSPMVELDNGSAVQ